MSTARQRARLARLRRIRGTNWLLAGWGGLLVAAGSMALLSRGGWAIQLSLVAAVGLGATGALALFENVRTGKGFAGSGSCAFAVTLYLAVYQSANQLLDGERRSILAYLGYGQTSVRDDALTAAALFVIAAGAFAVGEGVSAALRSPTAEEPRQRVASYRPVFLALLGIGIAVTLATGQRVDAAVLDQRGQVSGQGILAVLSQMLPLALVVGILYRHWESRVLAALSGVGLLVYVTFVQSRSMLLCVGLAVAVRVILTFRRRRVHLGDVLLLLVLGYLATWFIVAFGQWRSAIRYYGQSDFAYWLRESLPFPWQQLSSRGSLDTLDGLMLSINVDRTAVGASVLDPLKGIVNLVPSQLWAGKPEFLGPRITHQYTDFGGRSGIFLSGPGYLHVVFSGVVGMALASLALGLAASYLFSRTRRSPVLTVLVLYGLFRFMIGGDAFDLQYCLTLLLSLWLAVGVTRVLQLARGPARSGGVVACV